MPEPLLGLLKLCALALLYLFFLRVLRAVWAEVNPKVATVGAPDVRGKQRRSTRTGTGRRGKGSRRLVVVEPRERKGHGWDLGHELTIGRAAGCQITLEDSYVSQLHARVFVREGVPYVEDLGSTNGTQLNGTPLGGPTAVSAGAQLKIGRTVIELRR